MSLQPIRASADLARLVNEGFDLAIQGGHLVVRGVPFVDGTGRVARGSVVSVLDLAGDRTVRPRSHIAYFAGGTPCDGQGRPLSMLHPRNQRSLGDGLEVSHLMSSQPRQGGYADYYQKVTTYVAQIEAHAQAVEPGVSARRGVGGASSPVFSPFRYVDTASARAGIGAFSERLAHHRIGIVGLGGSGSYILDLVAKTPVGRIHLWDADVFEQHTAFRTPGAASAEEIAARPAKVDHLARIYSRMHRGIVPHRRRMTQDTMGALRKLDFVFIAVDSPASRRPLVEFLEAVGKPFIDVGLGLHVSDEGIVGTVRVTTSTSEMRGHVRDRARIPMSGGEDGEDPYSTNVQIADLNCLNAALAVIRWKRLVGFYADFEREHWSAYSIDGNAMLNEERPSGGMT